MSLIENTFVLNLILYNVIDKTYLFLIDLTFLAIYQIKTKDLSSFSILEVIYNKYFEFNKNIQQQIITLTIDFIFRQNLEYTIFLEATNRSKIQLPHI